MPSILRLVGPGSDLRVQGRTSGLRRDLWVQGVTSGSKDGPLGLRRDLWVQGVTSGSKDGPLGLRRDLRVQEGVCKWPRISHLWAMRMLKACRHRSKRIPSSVLVRSLARSPLRSFKG